MSSFSTFLRESIAEGKERAREIMAAVDETVRSEFGGQQQRDTKASRYLDAQHQKQQAQAQQRQEDDAAARRASSSSRAAAPVSPADPQLGDAQGRGAAAAGAVETTAAPDRRHHRTAPLLGDGAAPEVLPLASFTGRRPQLHLGDNSSGTATAAVAAAAATSPAAVSHSPHRQQPPASARRNPSPSSAGVGRSAGSGSSSGAQGGAALLHGSAGAVTGGGAAAVDYNQLALEHGVTPLYAAVLHGDHAAVKRMLGAGSRVDVNAPVDASRVPPSLLGAAVRAARLPRRPGSALELAVAQRDAAMVALLMDRNAVLRVPRQLSLEELRRKAHERAAQQAQHAQHAQRASPSSSGGGVRRGGQLEGWEDGMGVFDQGFLDDPEVQRTLGWRDYEAQLLTHTTPAIVERILKRQGYQLTLSRDANPHELAALFENAVAAGNTYVVEAMAGKGVDVNAPAFRREQLPLCVAANTLQPEMVAKLLHMGAALHNAEVMAGELFEGQRQRDNDGEEGAARAAPSASSVSSAAAAAARAAGAAAPAATAAAGRPASSLPRERWHPLPDACLMLLQVGAATGWPDLSRAPVPGGDDRFALAARVVEAMQGAGATAPDGMVAALRRRPPLADAPPEAQHGYAELLRILLRQREWSPQHHAAFPHAFKEHARLQLLCSAGHDVMGCSEHPTAGSKLLQNPGAVIEECDEEGEEEAAEGEGGAALPLPAAATAEEAVSASLAAASLTSRGAGEGNGKEEGSGHEEEEEDADAATRRVLESAGGEALSRIRADVHPLSRWLQ